MKGTGRNVTGQTATNEDFSSLIPKTPVKALVADPQEQILDPIDKAFKAKYNITVAEAPESIQRLHKRLNDYENEMNDKVVIYTVEQGADNQLKLFNVLMRALSEKDANLFMAVDLVLCHICNRQHDVYASRLVYRFIKGIKRSASEIDSYLRILEIFLIISDPAKRIEEARSNRVRKAVGTIDPVYKEAAFNLVTYLSQYKL